MDDAYEELLKVLYDKTNDNSLKWQKVISKDLVKPSYFCVTPKGIKICFLMKKTKKSSLEYKEDFEDFFVVVENSKGTIRSVIDGRNTIHIEPKMKELYSLLDKHCKHCPTVPEERLGKSIGVLRSSR